jgi:KDO2-lipid IV(A) lauroyltransferase
LKKLGNLFSYFTAFVFSLLPWKFNKWFAFALATLWLDILQIRKKIILENIHKVFPNIDENRQYQIAKNSMVALCRSFFDVIRIPFITDKWVSQNVVFEGEGLSLVKNEKQGVFFLCLHIGSGDLAAAITSSHIKPVTIISKRFKNKFLDEFWFALRGQAKTQFINAHSKGNSFEILAALKNNRGVAFVLDQFMGRPYGIETEFFGIKTGTAYGLALFAKKTQKPVYPLYTFWDDQDKFHICVDEPIDLTQELSETNEVITNKFNRALERIILKHPDHWMWVHKRWKMYE